MMLEEQLLEEIESQESIIIFAPKSTRVILTAVATFFLILCGKNFLETLFSLNSWWKIVFLFL